MVIGVVVDVDVDVDIDIDMSAWKKKEDKKGLKEGRELGK